MTPLAWLFLALVVLLIAALIWAVHTITKRTEEYRRELNAHETTRGEFRQTALEADRNAERVADLEAQLHDAWEQSGAAVIARAVAERERYTALANLAIVLGEGVAS